MTGRITSRKGYDRRWPVVQWRVVVRTETVNGLEIEVLDVSPRFWWPWERCIAIGHNPGA